MQTATGTWLPACPQAGGTWYRQLVHGAAVHVHRACVSACALTHALTLRKPACCPPPCTRAGHAADLPPSCIPPPPPFARTCAPGASPSALCCASTCRPMWLPWFRAASGRKGACACCCTAPPCMPDRLDAAAAATCSCACCCIWAAAAVAARLANTPCISVSWGGGRVCVSVCVCVCVCAHVCMQV